MLGQEQQPRKIGRPPGPLGDDQRRMYRGKFGFTGKEIREALIINYGNPTLAAQSLMAAEQRAGGDRIARVDQCRAYLKGHPAFAKEVEKQSDAGLLELAEGVITRKLRNNDGATARWFLEQKGAIRGYGKQMQLVLDPSMLSVDQLIEILDPAKMSDDQIDALLARMAERYDAFRSTEAAGPIIDHEPGTLPPPDDMAAAAK